MATDQTEPLRVFIANERDERLDVITDIVRRLGHDVIARNIGIDIMSVAMPKARAFRAMPSSRRCSACRGRCCGRA